MAPRVSSGTPECRPIGKLDFDHVLGRAEHRIDVAIALADDRRLAAVARRKFHRRRLRIEQRRQFVDLHRDEIGGVFGDVRVFGEHGGDRLADIAHDTVSQDRLAIRIERRDGALAKIDRRHVGDVGRSSTPRTRRAAPAPPTDRATTMRPWACAERTMRMCS